LSRLRHATRRLVRSARVNAFGTDIRAGRGRLLGAGSLTGSKAMKQSGQARSRCRKMPCPLGRDRELQGSPV
jgi:hypothetical protein